MAAYQCFCTAPVSPLRRAIAVCSAAAHSASRRCRVASLAAAASAAAERQLAVLHPDPAQQQPVPVRDEGLVLPAGRARPAR